MMDLEILKYLKLDELRELKNEILMNLRYQRNYWIKNKLERTEHLKSLIIQTRYELSQIQYRLNILEGEIK